MVAEVIKLSSFAPNSFQPAKVGGSVRKVNLPIQEAQPKEINRSARNAEQASQDIEAVRKAASDLNDLAKQINTNLKFSIDQPSGRSVITVTDTQTGDVIRQIPAKEILAVANLLRESVASDVDKTGVLLADQG